MTSVTKHQAIVDTHRHPIGPKLAAKIASRLPSIGAATNCRMPRDFVALAAVILPLLLRKLAVTAASRFFLVPSTETAGMR